MNSREVIERVALECEIAADSISEQGTWKHLHGSWASQLRATLCQPTISDEDIEAIVQLQASRYRISAMPDELAIQDCIRNALRTLRDRMSASGAQTLNPEPSEREELAKVLRDSLRFAFLGEENSLVLADAAIAWADRRSFRLFDLVRYARQYLFNFDAITKEEYAALLSDPRSKGQQHT